MAKSFNLSFDYIGEYDETRSRSFVFERDSPDEAFAVTDLESNS